MKRSKTKEGLSYSQSILVPSIIIVGNIVRKMSSKLVGLKSTSRRGWRQSCDIVVWGPGDDIGGEKGAL